eukprot:m.162473 g.162473  ORF g.162473 m.162473 type:complete len:318 (+) comp15204_c0_seq1:77-1030(+)
MGEGDVELPWELDFGLEDLQNLCNMTGEKNSTPWSPTDDPLFLTTPKEDRIQSSPVSLTSNSSETSSVEVTQPQQQDKDATLQPQEIAIQSFPPHCESSSSEIPVSVEEQHEETFQESVAFYLPLRKSFKKKTIRVDSNAPKSHRNKLIYESVEAYYKKQQKKIEKEKDPNLRKKLQNKQLKGSLEDFRSSLENKAWFYIRETPEPLYKLGGIDVDEQENPKDKFRCYLPTDEEDPPLSQIMKKLRENPLEGPCFLFFGDYCKECYADNKYKISHPHHDGLCAHHEYAPRKPKGSNKRNAETSAEHSRKKFCDVPCG